MKNFFRSENLIYRLLIALIVFIPIYPKFPLLEVANTYVAVRLEDIFFALVALIWFVKILPQLKNLVTRPIYQMIALFWVIGGISLFSGIYLTQTVIPHLGLLHWLRRVEYMMYFVMAATTFKSYAEVRQLLKIFIPVTILIVLYGFGQVLFKFPVISTTNREFSKGLILFLSPDARVNSTFAGHYDLAFYMTMVLVMLGSLFFAYKKLTTKAIMALTGLGSFVLLGMTAARVSFVATLAALSLAFWLNNKKLLVAGLIVAAVAVVGLVPDLRHRLVATVTVNILGGGGAKYELPVDTAPPDLNKMSEASKAALFMVDVVQVGTSGAEVKKVASDVAPGEPLDTTELGVFRSYGIRLDVEWPRAINAFLKNPILGTGYSSITIATDNDFLRSLGETGFLGTFALAGIIFILLKTQFKFIRQKTGEEKAFMVGVLCSFLALLGTGLFLDVLEASKIATLLWFLLGVAWSVTERENNEKNS